MCLSPLAGDTVQRDEDGRRTAFATRLDHHTQENFPILFVNFCKFLLRGR